MLVASTVSVKCLDGVIRTIYSHQNYYPGEQLIFLKTNFPSQDLAEKLIGLGDLNTIAQALLSPLFQVGSGHARRHSSIEEVIESEGEVYNYYYDKGDWLIFDFVPIK